MDRKSRSYLLAVAIVPATLVIASNQGLVSSRDELRGGESELLCDAPCTENNLIAIYECLDLGGPNCMTTACTINNIRFAQCRDATFSSLALPCYHHSDDSDWGRYQYTRANSCESNTPDSVTLADCQFSCSETFATPCVADECYGQLITTMSGPDPSCPRDKCGEGGS